MTGAKESNLLQAGSQILAVVFFPGFLPIYGLLIIFNAPTIFAYELAMRYGSLKGVILLLAFVNMTVVPVALMPILKYRNIIGSYSMNTRSDRIIPLAIGCIMYLITTIIYFSFNIPEIIRSFILATTILSVLILAITTKWKISVHSAGMGSLLATVMALSVRMFANLSVWWISLILITGLVMSSRLYLKSHTPSQIYSGFALGFLTIWFVMVIF